VASTRRAGSTGPRGLIPRFEHVAALAGSVEYLDREGVPHTLAVLQRYVPNQGNAWDYTQEYLARFLDDVTPDARSQPRGLHGPFLEVIGTLAMRTAQLHRALATTTGDPAFDPRPIETAQARQWLDRARSQVEATFAELERERTSWPASAAASAEVVLSQRDDLLARIEQISLGRLSGLMTRHHGNYELGQVLVAQDDFAIVDFEAEHGDPSDLFDSPLRDVAGMLRSLVYAGETAFDKAASRRPDDTVLLRSCTDRWIATSRQRFLDSYDSTIRNSGICPALPEARPLIDLFEIERNLQHARHQLRRRHESLQVVLRSLLRLVRRPEAGGLRRRDGT